MTGWPDYNRPVFRAVANDLRSQGHDVLSPAEHTIRPSATWGEAVGVCLDAMQEVQYDWTAGDIERPVLYCLHGHARSDGGAVELALARRWGWHVTHQPRPQRKERLYLFGNPTELRDAEMAIRDYTARRVCDLPHRLGGDDPALIRPASLCRCRDPYTGRQFLSVDSLSDSAISAPSPSETL
jgi:hypothetical protein